MSRLSEVVKLGSLFFPQSFSYNWLYVRIFFRELINVPTYISDVENTGIALRFVILEP